MLSPTAFACDRAVSDQPRDRDSKSIDGVAGCKRNNPYQQVEHGFHRAASHKQRARHPFPPYSQTPRSKRAGSRRAQPAQEKPTHDRMQSLGGVPLRTRGAPARGIRDSVWRWPVCSRWRSTVGWKIIAGGWRPVARRWRRHIGGSGEIRKCQRGEQKCRRNNRNGKMAHGILRSMPSN
jgi:hypothetical protein